MHDPVNNPVHYTRHPSGIEAIQITEHMNFCLGNAVKYCFRSGNKVQSDELEDLRKASWYARRELENVLGGQSVRNIGSWPSQKPFDWQDEELSAYQEWVHDLAVFLTSETSIRSCNGTRNFYLSEALRFDCLAFEWRPEGQQAMQFSLGNAGRKHPKEESAQNRTSWMQEMVGENNRRASEGCKIFHDVRRQSGKDDWYISEPSKSYTFRKKLVTYIKHEPETWRKRSIFYLATNEPIKALWYLDREIERRMKQPPESEPHGY